MPPHATRGADIGFSITGQAQQPPGRRGAATRSAAVDTPAGTPDGTADRRGRVKTSVRVGALRGAAETVHASARPGEDVVLLGLKDGPTLVLHPEDARDLMRAQGGAATRGGAAAGAAGATVERDVEVPVQLGWPTTASTSSTSAATTTATAATRGMPAWVGQAVLHSFEVVTGLGKEQAVSLTTAAITKRLDGRVRAGLYALDPDAEPGARKTSGQPLATPPPPAEGPLLVLLHGSFVDTASTFGSLWREHPATVRALFTHYAGRVYALDHPTLTESPIANALALARALPAGASLHLLTHSRGGLVAEVLARVCGTGAVGAEDLAHFKGEAYARHRADLTALAREVQAKGLSVARVLRVGCPARGTLLASRRLDAYLSVLKWGLELAAVPVAPELVDFLYEVARRRADPAELPGLEAMLPESGLVQWINSGGPPIPGALRVVAGDVQGDSLFGWVKTLLADAFYWTDNDLMVQTRSMYGGTARADQASFVLERGGKVSHFSYFKNERTVAAVLAGLTESVPPGFQTIGPLSWAGQDASGVRGGPPIAPIAPGEESAAPTEAATSPRVERAVLRSRGASAEEAASRPAVFVLPGILGSNLRLDGERIWVGLRFVNGLKKLAWDPATAERIQAESPVGNTYDTLVERLADSHEVIPFAYDWRRPTEDEARRLALRVEAALDAREASQQPVRILAHSMGGLLARTLQLERPAVWQRLMARPGARLLMLGTPNAGSWSPMQVLSGDDTFGNALVAFGSLFDNQGARKTMAGMPGFLQLQAGLLDPTLGLDRAERWQKLADDDIASLRQRSLWHALRSQTAVYAWSAPPDDILRQAVALRRRLDQQAASLGADAKKMLLVTGHARFTPDGFSMGADGLEYLNAVDGGDGRVTHASARLPGVSTWRVDAAHGDLPGVAEAFAGYLELLETGDTQRLPRADPGADTADTAEPGGAAPRAANTREAPAAGLPATVGNVEHVPSRPSRGQLGAEPPSRLADIFAAPADMPSLGGGNSPVDRAPAGKTAVKPLRVSVRNGDLKFVREPLIVGHYRSLMLTGSEAVIDRLLGRTMSQSLAAGLYPDAPGSQQIFVNLQRPDDNLLDVPRPHAVVVAGLGNEGKLRATDLIYSVCQAVLAYAQRVAESQDSATEFEMAATLVGSGGSGITAGLAAQLVAQGAFDATVKLAQLRPGRGRHGKAWPQLRQLTLVEFYLDRASEAWRALQVQAIASPEQTEVVGFVLPGEGAMRRSLDSSYRGAAYDLISALRGPEVDGEPTVAYTLDTRRARTEVRAQGAQGPLLRELVAKASNDANRDPQIGRTLFNLLVPVEMEPFLGGTSEMLIEVDSTTAVIPWELLDTTQQQQPQQSQAATGDDKPWAIRSKLLRKLQLDSSKFRMQVSDATADDSVLVIGDPLGDATLYPPLPGARAEAREVEAQLLDGPHRLGRDKVRALVSGTDDARGIINALFERAYRVVHIAGHGALGARGGVVLSGGTFLGANEVKAMRTVPELVFLNCCHLAGRPVNGLLSTDYDRARFAANIAEALIGVGVRCVIAAGWAVEDGPAEIFATTFYRVLLRGERFIDAVAQARLAAWNANRGGNTWAAYQCYGDPGWTWRRGDADARRAPVPPADEFGGVSSPVALTLALENLVVKMRFGGGEQAELRDKVDYLARTFGAAWGGMGAVAESLGLGFAEAGQVEQAIHWYRRAVAAFDGSASLRAAEQLGNLLARRGEHSNEPVRARRDIDEAIDRLSRLADIEKTPERMSLLGSAWKRAAMVAARARDGKAEQAALRNMATHYAEAEALELGNEGDQGAQGNRAFYPAMNGIAAELRLAFLLGEQPHIDAARWTRVRASLQAAAARRPDFWSVAGLIELRIQQALARADLAAGITDLVAELQGLKARVPSPWMWDSVLTQVSFLLELYQPGTEPERQAAATLLTTLAALAKV